MNKICTDIKQSQKLVELGLDVNTADFMWEYNPDKETYGNKPTIIPIDDYIFINDIPVWSISSLMNLLDDNAGLAKDYGFYYCYDNGKSHCTKHYQEAIDAVFEMVCWLKENGKI